MMKLDKRMVLVAAAVLAFAWFAAHNNNGGIIPNPFVPQRPDRPVLKFIARVAKTVLWVAVFAEPRPAAHGHHVVQARLVDGGREYLDHGDL